MATITARSSQGLDSLHDRISQIHDSLKDLRQKIPRIDGREPDPSDALFDTALSSTPPSLLSPSASLSSLSVPSSAAGSRPLKAPLAAVDPEAEEQLCSDISDRLRDIRSDYDLLVEDVQDMGWFVPSTAAPARSTARLSAHSIGAWENEDNDNDDDDDDGLAPADALHGTSSSASQAAVERARLAKALKHTDKAITATRRAFRTMRMNGLLRKQYALSEKVFQELEAYEDSTSDGDDDDDGSGASDDDDMMYDDVDVDDEAEKERLGAPAASSLSRTPSPRQQTAEASAASELTAALRQTHARIVGEVARSDFAAQTLEESSRALAELGDRYSSSSTGVGDINSGLKAARSMVRGLLVAQKSDTWYLQMSLYILASTVAWLFFRRLLYGPLWLLVWWPVRSAFGTAVWVGKTGASVGAGMGGSGGSSIVSVPVADVSFSSSVPTTSTVLAGVYATEAAGSSAGSSAGSAASLVDGVGRIVDEAAASISASAEPASTDAPNRMKRMWEEDVEAAKYEEQQQQEKAAQDAKKAQEAEAAEEKDTGKGKGKEAAVEKKDEL